MSHERSEPPALELAGISKTFESGGETVAVLGGIDLVLWSGGHVAIVGESGAGKSTLLNIIGLLDRADSGTVSLAGEVVSGDSEADLAAWRSTYLGFLFQAFHLMSHLSALDNVALGLQYRRVKRAEARDAAWEALHRVGLGRRATHRPTELSGGERQRVALARSIVGRPSMLLADEPTGNLDERNAAVVLDLLCGLVADGQSLVCVTHSARVAERADIVVELADGLLRPVGTSGRTRSSW